jgi:hypothetical protein
MGILLGMLPFIAFAAMTRFAEPAVCLWTAAAVSALLIFKEVLRRRSLKVLECGTLVLFAALAAYTGIANAHWDVSGVRSIVDAGLLLIIVVSLLVQRPFTLQYAREEVAPAVAQSPLFIRTNYIITGVWAVALAIIVAADLALHYFPSSPVWLGSAVIVAALAGAFGFTTVYPKRLASRIHATK